MAWSKDNSVAAKLAAAEALVQAKRAEEGADYIDEKQPLIDEFIGEQTNLQTQLNDLVLQSGTDIAEVVQARGGFATVNDRLVDTSEQLAEKVKKGDLFVSVKDYGAKGDGITDDSLAIKNAHIAANLTGMKVVYPKAKYLIGSGARSIPIFTDVDMRNAELIIDQSASSENVFVLPTTGAWTNIDLPTLNTYTSQFKADNSYIPILKSLAPQMSLVRLTYSVAGTLTTDNTVREIVNETLVHTQNGKIIGNIIHDAETFTQAKRRDIDLPISINQGKIKLIGNNQSSSFKVFFIERDNVKIKSFDVDRDFMVGGVRKVVFHFEACFNSGLDDVNSYNPEMTNMPYSGDDLHFEGYILQMNYCVNFFTNNFNASTKHEADWSSATVRPSWGSMGGNGNKNWFVNNSHISRIDCHAPSNGIFVTNSTLDWIQVCGTGKLSIDNSVFMSSMYGGMLNLFSGAQTSRGQWLGEIEITNCTYRPVMNIVDHYLLHPNAVSYFKYQDYTPFNSLIIENLTIDMRHVPNPTKVRVLTTYLVGDNLARGLKGLLPRNIEVVNVMYKTTEPVMVSALPVNSGTTLNSNTSLTKYNFRNVLFMNRATDVNVVDGDVLSVASILPTTNKLEINYHNCRVPIICPSSVTPNVDFNFYQCEVNSFITTRAGMEHKGKLYLNQSYVNLKSYGNGLYIPFLPSATIGKVIKLNGCRINPYQTNVSNVVALSDFLIGNVPEVCNGCYVDLSLVQPADLAVVKENIYKLNNFAANYGLTRFVAVPTTSTTVGVVGDWSADATYLYVCHATSVWKRIAISTW